MLTSFIILIILLAIFFLWILPTFHGAPFEPSTNRALDRIISLSSIKPSRIKENKKIKIADLGSGNGKIVIEFAKFGCEAHGFEINPLLVWISRRKIKKLGLEKRAFIHRKNFWKQDFSKFNIITTFQINVIMPDLERKLRKELKKGAKVISNHWKFPNWKPKKTVKDILLYVK